MRKWSRTTRLIFLAAASVYSLGASGPGAEKSANSPTQPASTTVRLLEEVAAPAAAPTTQPAAAQPAAVQPAAAQPVAAQPAPAQPAPTQPAAAQPAPAAPAAAQPVAAQPAAKAEGQSLGKAQVSVSDVGTVEIHVNETSLVEVLRMLSLESQKNIIASKEVRGTVTANLYNVTIREALDAIVKANGFGYREKGNFIYVYSAKELAEIEKAERQTVVEVFRLHYTPVANVVNMIKPVMSADGQVAFTAAALTGIEAGGKDTGGNSYATEDSLVIRDYPENIERIRKVLKEVDRRPQQVLVEATIVAARLTNDNTLGVDFNVVGGVDFAKILTNGGQIIGSNLPGGNDAQTSNDTVHSVGTGTNFTSAQKPGFKVGFVSSNVSVFLNALEEITDTVVLGNPKVLTLNKQRGEVLVGREDGYLTTTVTESTSVQSVEFLKTGTKLIFRPYIGDDGYIRMEVHPEDSDGKVVNGLPQKTTTEMTTNIMVKDGNTIVIGGLFRDSSLSSRSQVPVVGSIPVIGALFGGQTDATIREEVIILLTPHIVKDDNAYASVSEQVMRDAERLRVGVRKGMMPWGRERLAECCYNDAVAEMNKPNPNRQKALWNLNCATNLNPLFLEAMRMKENLTGRELMAVDNSTVHSFVKREIMAEQAAEKKSVMTPTTMPVARASANRPAVAAAPTTQPAVAAAPTTQPAEPAPVAATPADSAPAATVTMPDVQPFFDKLRALATSGHTSNAPTTQPTGPADEADTALTEMPVEEVEGDLDVDEE